MRDYQAKGLKLEVALDCLDLTRNQYYYQPVRQKQAGKISRPGCPPSTHTRHYDVNGCMVLHPNQQVLKRIEDIQSDDDLRCGYKRMTNQLEVKGYEINAKKVYRIMRDQNLLLSRKIRHSRPYVLHRCACPERPLTLMEMDIKMIWVEEYRRYAYNLTILDTFTRVALYWTVGYHMKWEQIREAWTWVIEHHLQATDMLARELHIEVRSDNGPQFVAGKLQEFLQQNSLHQVFTHPYTPQENGHVESFHAILATALRHDHFWTLSQLEARLTVFYDKYNNERVHSATAGLPPRVFWMAWEQNLISMRKGKRKNPIFRLKVPRYTLGSYLKPEGASCPDGIGLEAQFHPIQVQEEEEKVMARPTNEPLVLLSTVSRIL